MKTIKKIEELMFFSLSYGIMDYGHITLTFSILDKLDELTNFSILDELG